MKAIGYGKEYRYAHDDPDAKAEMTCLPSGLVGKVYLDDSEISPQRPQRAQRQKETGGEGKV